MKGGIKNLIKVIDTFEGYDSSINQSAIVHKTPECSCTERRKEKDRDSKFMSSLYRKSDEAIRD